jgi:hypothetical protein
MKYMKTLLAFLLFAAAPLLADVSFTTSVTWEAFGPAGPQRPTISSISWRMSDSAKTLAVRDPDSGEVVIVRYLGTKTDGPTTGVMMAGTTSSGRRVLVNLLGRAGRVNYNLTIMNGSKEHMIYGPCSDELEQCFHVYR